MDTRTKTILMWSGVGVLVVVGIIMISLAFGGGSNEAPEQELNAIQTHAAETIAAQVQTLQSGMLSPTPGSFVVLPTATGGAGLPSPTLPVQTPILIPTVTTVPGGASGCDNAAFISDVTIPDGTVVAPGQTFTKTWRVTNNGTCAWTATYQVIFLYGEGMSGKATAIGKTVKPGESADISVALIAPAATSGNLTGTWRLSNDKSQPFGTLLTVVIKSGATGTMTVTPTKTTTPTVGVTPYPAVP